MITSEGGDPGRLRSRVLRRIRRAANADYAVWFTIHEVSDRFYYSPLLCAGDSEAPAVWSGVAGRAAADSLQSAVRYPRPAERRAFQPIDVRARWVGFEDPKQYDERRLFYDPRGIRDEVRMLVYHGRKFLGWIGAFRWKDRPAFTDEDIRVCNGTVEHVKAGLTAADHLECHDDTGSIYLVSTPEGQILHASERAVPWLTKGRREQLAVLVKRVHCGDDDEPVWVFAGAELTLSRMMAPSGDLHYMVHLVPAPVPTIAPDALLTAAQREVAEYAVAGATVDEIARTLGRSRNTVKYHLKNIYELLGIGCRVELAATLGV